ncbi:ABC transporter permease [Kaistia geumhonensis]|uniref:Peptide/nickel transport system permease protein n=1 Tax=Kaistia geumhonensis TaxID=410839 RepID=A0ABU0MA19_9HYPH|nr:ABC transporter permease [Kaistia geumhonensis]MCX5480501.1 ABC transporter permease [Kaistia geumhonensis]MDQ0517799.1 peptide/nickel transport system permease protein [Kaistia geumhonensis]
MAMASETVVTKERATKAPAGRAAGWRAFYVRVFAGDPLGLAGVTMLAALLLVALFGPLLVTHDPILTTPGTLLPPSAEHWFGTDDFGRDVFSRTLVSLRIDFIVAGVGVTGAILIGSLIGLVCGYRGGWLDDTLMRFVDIIQSFPLILVAMVLVLAIGPSVGSIVIVTVLINIPLYARVIRGQTLAVKHLDYVDAARCSGATEFGIMFRHVLPNTLNPIAIHASLNLAAAVGNVAVLSFLGIGIRPPTPDLGVMVAEGTRFLVQGAWWMSVFPGLVLSATIFSLNLLGDALESGLDPRRQER